MDKLILFARVTILLSCLTGCVRASPVNSEYCVLVGEGWESFDKVVSLLDPFALEQKYLRGEKGPKGLSYGNSKSDLEFLLNVTSVGPIGVEVAFFPKEPGTYESERLEVEAYIENEVSKYFNVVSCDEMEGYGKGAIYGFEDIRI